MKTRTEKCAEEILEALKRNKCSLSAVISHHGFQGDLFEGVQVECADYGQWADDCKPVDIECEGG